MNEGVYQSVGALNRTDFDALINSTSSNGSRCTRLYQATCYRSRDALGKAFSGVQADAATAPASGPQQIGQVCSYPSAMHFLQCATIDVLLRCRYFGHPCLACAVLVTFSDVTLNRIG